MRNAAEITHYLQCLITLRTKAEEIMHPAREPEDYQRQRQLFTTIASNLAGAPWEPVLNELGGHGRFVLDHEGALGPHAGLNAYWLGEGAVPLAWLVGVLPSLPPPAKSVNIVDDLATVKLPHLDRPGAEQFAAQATLAVAEAIATETLSALITERDRLITELNKKKKKPDNELLKQRSRCIERARALGWALGIDATPPRPA